MPLGMADRVGLRRQSARLSGADLAELSAPRLAKVGKVDVTWRQLAEARGVTPSQLMEAFVTHYLMENFDDPAATPDLHREMWEMCCSEYQFVAIAAPRDHAKSTAVTHAYTLANVLFRQKQFAVIISSTYAIAVEFLRDIAQELSENEEIIRDFEIAKFVKEAEDNLIVKMRDGYKFRIVARGSEQKMRGLKWGSKRPDLMIFDDIEDDEQVESKDRREKLAKWVMNAAIPAGKKSGCLYRLVGTVMHFDSFLENSLNDGFWHAKRYKAHASFDDFSNILWPSKYDEAWFRAKRAMYIARGNPDGYSQEYLNNPVSEQEAYFRRDDLIPYPVGFSGRAHRKYLRVYAGWDFAVSKDERADYTVCVVVGVDSDGYKYVLDVRRGRFDTQEIINTMFEVERGWAPEFHAVEKGVIEKAIGPFLWAQARDKQLYPSLSYLTSSKDKRVRAKAWQGATRAKHVMFDHAADWWPAMRDEMVRFPKGEHDDIVDAQSILGRLLEQLFEGKTEQEVAAEPDEDLAELQRVAIGAIGRCEITGY